LHAAAPKDAEIGTGIAPSSASGREEVIESVVRLRASLNYIVLIGRYLS
jgi:hypothetical protein